MCNQLITSELHDFSSVKPSNFSRKRKYPLESFWLLKKILLLFVLWFSAASVNAPTIPLILDALLWRGGGGEGEGEIPWISSDKDDRRFFGVWNFRFRVFLGRKFWQVFFGVAWFKWGFLGVFKLNYLKIRVSARVSRPRRSANKVRPNLFLKISFFVGFLGG